MRKEKGEQVKHAQFLKTPEQNAKVQEQNVIKEPILIVLPVLSNAVS